jgi:hypothetical protein
MFMLHLTASLWADLTTMCTPTWCYQQSSQQQQQVLQVALALVMVLVKQQQQQQKGSSQTSGGLLQWVSQGSSGCQVSVVCVNIYKYIYIYIGVVVALLDCGL